MGADVINIHAGGVYGNKTSALDRVARALTKLNKRIRSRLTFENDDRSYTPADLLPFCQKHAIPFVYDAHHQCWFDINITVEVEAKAKELAVKKLWSQMPA